MPRKKMKPVGLVLERQEEQIQKDDEFELSKSGSFNFCGIAKIGRDGITVVETTPSTMTPHSFTSGTYPNDPLPDFDKLTLETSPSSSSSSSSSSPSLSTSTSTSAEVSRMDSYSQQSQSPDSSSPKIAFDDLKILGKIGSGASANVFKVKHEKTGETFAQKIITVSLKEKPKLIISEFKTLFACACPHIVKLHGAFCRDYKIYMLLEYMNCGSLEDVIKTVGAFPEPVISKIASQILKALVYVHQEMKAVHRDIKPANILLNQKGEVKLADFGMAGVRSKNNQNAADGNSNGTMFLTFQGTLTYMSPERIRGDKHSYNSDIWSLGLALAECALAKYPIELNECNIFELLKYFEENQFCLPDSFTVEFKEFIFLCLQYSPQNRASAEELLEHEFIKKYEKVSPSISSWLKSTYVKIKKEQKSRRTKQ